MLRPFFLLMAMSSLAVRAAAPEWVQFPASSAAVPEAMAKLDAATIPSELADVVRFQRVLLKIRAGAPVADWREALVPFANSADKGPVATGLRELALAWEARARMEDLDRVLRGYYRKNVSFPAKLDDVAAQIPPNATKDSWGGAWRYAPTVPKGFSQKFAGQRYLLACEQHPQVRSISATLGNPAPARGWRASQRQVAGQSVLEFRLPSGQTVATQPGGRVEDATVLYVGPGWVLLSDLERFFTVDLTAPAQPK